MFKKIFVLCITIGLIMTCLGCSNTTSSTVSPTLEPTATAIPTQTPISNPNRATKKFSEYTLDEYINDFEKIHGVPVGEQISKRKTEYLFKNFVNYLYQVNNDFNIEIIISEEKNTIDSIKLSLTNNDEASQKFINSIIYFLDFFGDDMSGEDVYNTLIETQLSDYPHLFRYYDDFTCCVGGIISIDEFVANVDNHSYDGILKTRSINNIGTYKNPAKIGEDVHAIVGDLHDIEVCEATITLLEVVRGVDANELIDTTDARELPDGYEYALAKFRISNDKQITSKTDKFSPYIPLDYLSSDGFFSSNSADADVEVSSPAITYLIELSESDFITGWMCLAVRIDDPHPIAIYHFGIYFDLSSE